MRARIAERMQIFLCQQAGDALRLTNDDEGEEEEEEEAVVVVVVVVVVIVPVELAHTRYLEEVRSVRSSSAILITTSFSHWIRWRVKIEGAALFVSSSDLSSKGDSPVKCTFFFSLCCII
jgi:hypothetical protein